MEIVHLVKEQIDMLRPDRREELIHWVAGLGVKPDDVDPALLIERGEKSYLLHLSRRLRDDAGKLRMDWAHGRPVTEPLVVDLGSEQTWPVWLNEEPICRQCGLPREDCAASKDSAR